MTLESEEVPIFTESEMKLRQAGSQLTAGVRTHCQIVEARNNDPCMNIACFIPNL